MKNIILFSDFNFSPSRVDFKVTIDNETIHEVYFEINKEYNFENNEVAIACSTLCGKSYKNIVYKLPISEYVIKDLQEFTGSTIVCDELVKDKPKYLEANDQDGIVLNFSGGFDSLAAYYIMPKHTHLVAIDFGGWFQRETDWFKKFNPICISTNFRQLHLDKESWTFMGVGAILTKRLCHAKYVVFGTALEESKSNFNNGFNIVKNKSKPFSTLGYYSLRIINGLTEVGTAMIISHYEPEVMNEALVSLSMPKTEKRYRKQLLTQLVAKRFHRNIEIEITEPPVEKMKFGTSNTEDIMILYIIKHLGLAEANKTIIDIPEDYIKLADTLSLDFYERFNTNFLHNIPEDIREYYLNRIIKAGVLPYTENDWKELKCVYDYVDNYKIPVAEVAKKGRHTLIEKCKRKLKQYYYLFNKIEMGRK